MKNENLLKLQAYLDHELTAEESHRIDEWLESDQEARAILQELRDTKALLADNEWPVKLPETREFYWSKIERAITRQSLALERASSPVPARWWLRLAVPLAGAALLIFLLMTVPKPLMTSSSLAGYFHEIETPLEENNAISFHSQAAAMTVVWIDTNRGDDAEED